MAKDRLTQRQNEAYEFIRGYMDQHRKPPTLQEIGEALGIASTNGVYKLLQALEKKGWIEREKHAARGIELVDETSDPFGMGSGQPRLPIISRTASDQPERLRERPKGTISVDDRLLRQARDPDACLVGQAGDDGMNGAAIQKGDLLLIEEMDWSDLENGALVAVLVQAKLLARTFHFANGRLHLRPADRHYTEDTFPPDHPGCYVIGRLLGLIRTL
ncbi:LexA family transcriptional regulator [Salinibacter sp. 10B]|uniref:LexA family protein n=1 Tax=Salinibacter sp. 10B TaxID=1923971 RepID=UPI000D2B4B48|nr:S24 family peptidase [Salinibacter sp. 10B]PQJ35410.1 LexA family transcriptional regulator [Salinibacter sp. 10B]